MIHSRGLVWLIYPINIDNFVVEDNNLKGSKVEGKRVDNIVEVGNKLAVGKIVAVGSKEEGQLLVLDNKQVYKVVDSKDRGLNSNL